MMVNEWQMWREGEAAHAAAGSLAGVARRQHRRPDAADAPVPGRLGRLHLKNRQSEGAAAGAATIEDPSWGRDEGSCQCPGTIETRFSAGSGTATPGAVATGKRRSNIIRRSNSVERKIG